MNKCILFVGLMVVAGFSSEAVKSEAVKWVSVGTLVSVGPDMESTRPAGRAKSAILGETKLSRTRIETTKGVYIISEKIGIAEMGVPVRVGYDFSDENQDTALYLAIRGKQYKIVH